MKTNCETHCLSQLYDFFLLYPFFDSGDAPEPILEYVEKTKNLFLEGSQCGNAVKREEYTLKIFDLIEPLR